MSKYHNAGIWSVDQRHCVLCSKIYSTWDSLLWLPAGSRQAARDTRICETRLLDHRGKVGEILIKIQKYSYKKISLKMLSRPHYINDRAGTRYSMVIRNTIPHTTRTSFGASLRSMLSDNQLSYNRTTIAYTGPPRRCHKRSNVTLFDGSNVT